MARHGLSRLLVAVALLAASAAWLGFTLQRTVFEPARSERVVRVLLDSPQVRNVLVQRVVEPNLVLEIAPARLQVGGAVARHGLAGTRDFRPKSRPGRGNVPAEIEQPPVVLDLAAREPIDELRAIGAAHGPLGERLERHGRRGLRDLTRRWDRSRLFTPTSERQRDADESGGQAPPPTCRRRAGAHNLAMTLNARAREIILRPAPLL